MKFTLSTVSEIGSPGHSTRAGVSVRKSLPSNISVAPNWARLGTKPTFATVVVH